MNLGASVPESAKSRRRYTDESRAERKRIQDRLAQRATGERTKSRIAHLEQCLSSLEAGDKHGEISNLTQIIDNLRNDNNRLRNALLRMRTTIDQAVLSTEYRSNSQSELKPCACDTQATCTCQRTTFATSTTVFDSAAAALRHNSISSTDTSEVTEVVNRSTTGMNLDHEAALAVTASKTSSTLTRTHYLRCLSMVARAKVDCSRSCLPLSTINFLPVIGSSMWRPISRNGMCPMAR